MSTLTVDQITDLRRNWIRDEIREGVGRFRGLSQYNIERQFQFFTDDQITAIDDYVMNEYAEELSDLEWYKQSNRLGRGDTEAEALVSGTASQGYARFRLIRAEAFERMLADAGFRLAFGKDKSPLDGMSIQIKKDRNFVLRRTGVTTVPLRRG